MTERINTPFTNEHFAAYCLKMVGQPYWYGCCGYKAKTSLLSRKAKQYPSHYTASRMSRYKGADMLKEGMEIDTEREPISQLKEFEN